MGKEKINACLDGIKLQCQLVCGHGEMLLELEMKDFPPSKTKRSELRMTALGDKVRSMFIFRQEKGFTTKSSNRIHKHPASE